MIDLIRYALLIILDQITTVQFTINASYKFHNRPSKPLAYTSRWANNPLMVNSATNKLNNFLSFRVLFVIADSSLSPKTLNYTCISFSDSVCYFKSQQDIYQRLNDTGTCAYWFIKSLQRIRIHQWVMCYAQGIISSGIQRVITIHQWIISNIP